jgi:hypothetical protein
MQHTERNPRIKACAIESTQDASKMSRRLLRLYHPDDEHLTHELHKCLARVVMARALDLEGGE